ncbi:hypothetical protein BgiMline_018132 [Biomphalaria glabrata]|nr:hypothetical protein BgiMline_005745 [Biomphalaria glabrata]
MVLGKGGGVRGSAILLTAGDTRADGITEARVNKRPGADAEFPQEKVGDDVIIRIPDFNRGRYDPRGVLVVMKEQVAFNKPNAEQGDLQQ